MDVLGINTYYGNVSAVLLRDAALIATVEEERGRREMRVVGEVIASKPAWKRRRASENDDELLQLLADGLGQWIATHKQAPQH